MHRLHLQFAVEENELGGVNDFAADAGQFEADHVDALDLGQILAGQIEQLFLRREFQGLAELLHLQLHREDRVNDDEVLPRPFFRRSGMVAPASAGPCIPIPLPFFGDPIGPGPGSPPSAPADTTPCSVRSFAS